MQTIYTVDRPCGLGKTTDAIAYSILMAHQHHNTIIAQPTTDLMRLTMREIKAMDPTVNVRTFTYHNTPLGVVSGIESHLTNSMCSGEIILITHEALMRLENKARSAWHLIIDEAPLVFEHIELKVNETHAILTQHIRERPLANGISEIQIGNKKGLEQLRDNRTGDQNYKTFREVCGAVLNQDYEVLVIDRSITKLKSETNTSCQTDFVNILAPSFFQGYKDVTVMSGAFNSTYCGVMWRTLFAGQVQLVPHPVISQGAETCHGNGHRLTIKYLFEDDWSGRFYKKAAADQETIKDQVVDLIAKYFGSRSFVWHDNVEEAKHRISSGQLPVNMKLPTVSHGQNIQVFIECHNVALLGAFNMKPAAYSLLTALGISNNDAKAMLTYNTEYQAMMRCSLRDKSCEEPVEVIVCSKGSALWLAGMFPGCRVEKIINEIASLPLKPRKTPMTNADKQRKYRQRQNAKKQV